MAVFVDNKDTKVRMKFTKGNGEEILFTSFGKKQIVMELPGKLSSKDLDNDDIRYPEILTLVDPRTRYIYFNEGKLIIFVAMRQK